MDGPPGISDDLINFWDGSIRNKMAAAAIKRIIGWCLYFLIIFYILEWSWADLEIYTRLQQCHLSMCRHANIRLWFV